MFQTVMYSPYQEIPIIRTEAGIVVRRAGVDLSLLNAKTSIENSANS
jgi:hypothetical protein